MAAADAGRPRECGEGILRDLVQGRIPNTLAERGWKAEWQYNRKNLAQRILVGVLIAATLVAFLLNQDED